jgi:hypothetical protein
MKTLTHTAFLFYVSSLRKLHMTLAYHLASGERWNLSGAKFNPIAEIVI